MIRLSKPCEIVEFGAGAHGWRALRRERCHVRPQSAVGCAVGGYNFVLPMVCVVVVLDTGARYDLLGNAVAEKHAAYTKGPQYGEASAASGSGGGASDVGIVVCGFRDVAYVTPAMRFAGWTRTR